MGLLRRVSLTGAWAAALLGCQAAPSVSEAERSEAAGWYLEGLARESAGDEAGARAAFRAADEAGPDDRRAIAVERAREDQAAVAAELARAHLAEGLLCERALRLEAALEFYRRAAEIDPGDPVAWFDRGNVEFRLRRFGDAARSFSRAAEIGDPFPEAASLEALALAWAGRDLERALALARAATRLGRLEERALYVATEAWVLARAGRPIESARRLDEALEAAGDEAGFAGEVMAYRALAAAVEGRDDQAARDWTEALALDPDSWYRDWFEGGPPTRAALRETVRFR